MVTPNIDQLASKSVRSFLTSRRPDTTHVYDLHTYWRNAGGNYTTLPQHFKNNGYYTQGAGKVFHPGASSDNDDPISWTGKYFHARDANSGYKNESEQCPGLDGKLHDYVVCPVNVSQTPHKTLPDLEIADFAVNWLRNYSHKGSNQPFFLAVGFHKPHLIWKYPEEYTALYPLENIQLPKVRTKPPAMPPVAWYTCTGLLQHEDIQVLHYKYPYGPIPDSYALKLRQAYSAASSYTDSNVGRVLQALDQYGFGNNTIISFIGDHGWSLADHGQWCKQSNFERTVNIPFLLSVPGMTRQLSQRGRNFPYINPLQSQPGANVTGRSTDALVEAVDIYPTLTELAQLPVPDTCPENPFMVDFCSEGASLVPVLKHVIDPTTPLTWKQAAFSQYRRFATDPANPKATEHDIMGYTMRTDLYRYTEWIGFNGTSYQHDWDVLYARELYVHTSDPEEDNNVAEHPDYQQLVVDLSRQLRNGWRQYDDGSRAN
nr:hypothetical protein BaRGS_019705 [Batillaria attramentaria]